METLTVSDTSPYLGKKNSPVRSCGFKRVSGKGVFKGNDLSAFWGDAELTRRTPNSAKKRRFWRS